MGLVRVAAWLAAPLLFVACGLDDEGTLEATGGSSGQSGAGGVGASAGSGVGGASGSGVGGTSGAGGSAGTGGAGAAGAGGSAGTGAAGAGGSAGTGAAGAGGSAGSGAAGAGGTGGSQTIPSCTELYMFVFGVKDICNDADPCKLYIDSEGVNGQTCKAICEGKGGECTGAHDISGSLNACTQPSSGPATCTTNDQSNMICFCSRGCGGKPPCTTGQTCVNGSCI